MLLISLESVEFASNAHPVLFTTQPLLFVIQFARPTKLLTALHVSASQTYTELTEFAVNVLQVLLTTKSPRFVTISAK